MKGSDLLCHQLRVSGLASYESMIEQLMDAQRAPSIKLQQDRQILEWQQEAYRDINNNLRTFRDTAREVMGLAHRHSHNLPKGD